MMGNRELEGFMMGNREVGILTRRSKLEAVRRECVEGRGGDVGVVVPNLRVVSGVYRVFSKPQ